jgi:hypothetical protein
MVQNAKIEGSGRTRNGDTEAVLSLEMYYNT